MGVGLDGSSPGRDSERSRRGQRRAACRAREVTRDTVLGFGLRRLPNPVRRMIVRFGKRRDAFGVD